MILNRAEFALMNNPLRAAIQRHLEARRLLRMGGALHGGRALEVGCGRGVGTRLILDVFGAETVDAFDLDPRMVARARARLSAYGPRTRLWVGDVTAIGAPDSSYDAVFDFGILHHVPDWQRGLAEIHRVLRPGGRLYAEEVMERFIVHPITRRILDHPLRDRFDAARFRAALATACFEPLGSQTLWGSFAWFTARKPAGHGPPPASGSGEASH